MNKLFLGLMLVALFILGACSSKPCTYQTKFEYIENMKGFEERAWDMFDNASVFNTDDLTQRLTVLRRHAADEPVPGCDGARDYRSASLDILDLFIEAAKALVIEKDDIKAEELFVDIFVAKSIQTEAEDVLLKAKIDPVKVRIKKEQLPTLVPTALVPNVDSQ